MKCLYEILGVDAAAPPGDIRAAYRRLAQQHHPDKGGDKEAFQQIQQAYGVLSDLGKRARYDATGTIDRPEPSDDEKLTAEAQQMLVVVIDALLSKIDPDMDNLAEHVSLAVQGQQKSVVKQLDGFKAAQKKAGKALKRFQAKQGKDNVIALLMQPLVEKWDAPIAEAERALKVMERLLLILAGHTYETVPMTDELLFQKMAEAMARQPAGRMFYNPGT